MHLRLGHSPDPDDAFMFYALAKDLVDAEGLEFEHILDDIESLNERAENGELEITALSVHAYAYLHDRYMLLPHGASMGDGYGPILVSRRPMRDRMRRSRALSAVNRPARAPSSRPSSATISASSA